MALVASWTTASVRGPGDDHSGPASFTSLRRSRFATAARQLSWVATSNPGPARPRLGVVGASYVSTRRALRDSTRSSSYSGASAPRSWPATVAWALGARPGGAGAASTRAVWRCRRPRGSRDPVGPAASLEPARRSGWDCCAGRGRTARLPRRSRHGRHRASEVFPHPLGWVGKDTDENYLAVW